MWLKIPNIIFKPPFWGTSKNWRLDLKVWTDPSWFLVLKNGLKKHSSLITELLMFEVDVKMWRRREGEKKEEED